MLVAGALITVCGYSQTVPEKVIKDPKRNEDAGKADVISMDKKAIFDSTTLKNSSEVTDKKTTRKTDNKKGCRKKAKRSQA